MNNLWFGLLLGTSTLFIGFNGAWFGIIDTMINLFSSEVEKVVDIRETVDDIRDTNFDYFDEKVESELMFGIELSEYDSVVNSLAINLGLPGTVKDTLLSAKNQLRSRDKALKEFHFAADPEGHTGPDFINVFVFGRVAAVRRPLDCWICWLWQRETIDLAYAIYIMKFRLPPMLQEHHKIVTYIASSEEKKWNETARRGQISIKEKDQLEMYFRKKALEGFKDSYIAFMSDEQKESLARLGTGQQISQSTGSKSKKEGEEFSEEQNEPVEEESNLPAHDEH